MARRAGAERAEAALVSADAALERRAERREQEVFLSSEAISQTRPTAEAGCLALPRPPQNGEGEGGGEGEGEGGGREDEDD
jgi:hypothetical protein